MAASKTGCTLVLKRIYDAPIDSVWNAWTDPKELGLWYMAGTDHIVHFCEADVRVGGTYRVGFGPPGKTPYIETGRYLEVVRPTRLVFEETVSFEGRASHSTVNVIELRALGDRTELVLSCSGEESWRAGEGWMPCLDSLGSHLAARAAQAFKSATPILFVSDVKITATFFAEKLGFAVDFLYGEPPFYGAVSRGAACLHLRFVHTPFFAQAAAQEPSLVTATIEVLDVRALFEEFEARGVVFPQTLQKQEWGGTDFHVRDPDGNVVSFVTFG